MAEKKMSKLKPCPFCGGEVYTRVNVVGKNTLNYVLEFTVTCEKCGTKKEYDLTICDTDFNEVVEVIDIVKADWNRRADNATD